MSSPYNRHTLVWLSAAGWQDAAAMLEMLAPAHRHVLQRWQAHDWPAVVRRHDADCPADMVCLGIAAPPDADGVKLRLPLRVHVSQVRAVRGPLAIAEVSEVVEHAVPQWRAHLRGLHNEATVQGLSIGVFGSLALQALTGQAYLRSSSDIDVLLAPTDATQLAQGISLLKHYAQWLPLDGEVAFPDGAAVSWKEWVSVSHQPDNRVLVKRRSDVALVRVGDMTAMLENTPCPA